MQNLFDVLRNSEEDGSFRGLSKLEQVRDDISGGWKGVAGWLSGHGKALWIILKSQTLILE